MAVLKLIVVGDLDGIRSALTVAQQSIQKTSGERLSQFEAKLTSLGADSAERAKLEAQYLASRSWYDGYLPRIVAGAFLTYTFAVVEEILREFARNAQRDNQLALALRDIHGPPIDKALTYLQKAAGLNVSTLSGWPVLREFQDLRNAVVHRAGRLGDNTKERTSLKHLATRFPKMLEVSDWTDGNAQLEFGPELVEQFAKEADALFEELLRMMYP
ncbi:MAG: hypothetical protein F9K16_12735 [Thermoanaerobaculia bacterium]|nr:MAG: hypothetical protein F9K16_12735 [Thermoanaerobaculia bacterium]